MSTGIHPRAYATVNGPNATYVDSDGHSEPVQPGPGEDIRHAIIRRASDDARRTGAPIELFTSGDRGTHRLLVGRDGDLSPIDIPSANVSPIDAVAGDELRSRRAAHQHQGKEVRQETPQPAQPDETAPAAEPSTRPSFLTPSAEPTHPTGWRHLLHRIGITIPPSQAAQRRAGWEAAVSRQWAGCRSLAIANGKGGVGKTMTTAMLAAVYARWGGGNVLAWDNNDTRGTLGWRTEQGLYDTTLRDLLPAATALLSPDAGVSDIARFVHHQATDRYDVLRSNPELLAADQRITSAQFDLLLRVAARYYRMVVVDSGNDESADRWIRMIDSTDQLIVPTLATPESAESAALLLDALRDRDERSAALARGAVVVVTQSERSLATGVRAIADGFNGLVRAVEIVPFDPALKSGPLRFDALRPATQDAWLAVAASAASDLDTGSGHD
jgi:cellulose biosynthesis protein BcsQ